MHLLSLFVAVALAGRVETLFLKTLRLCGVAPVPDLKALQEEIKALEVNEQKKLAKKLNFYCVFSDVLKSAGGSNFLLNQLPSDIDDVEFTNKRRNLHVYLLGHKEEDFVFFRVQLWNDLMRQNYAPVAVNLLTSSYLRQVFLEKVSTFLEIDKIKTMFQYQLNLTDFSVISNGKKQNPNEIKDWNNKVLIRNSFHDEIINQQLNYEQQQIINQSEQLKLYFLANKLSP